MKYQLIIESESYQDLKKLGDVLSKGYETHMHANANSEDGPRRFFKKNKPWTTDDDEHLIRLYNDTVLPIKAIAMNLERTTVSTQQRIHGMQKKGMLGHRNNRSSKCIITKL